MKNLFLMLILLAGCKNVKQPIHPVAANPYKLHGYAGYTISYDKKFIPPFVWDYFRSWGDKNWDLANPDQSYASTDVIMPGDNTNKRLHFFGIDSTNAILTFEQSDRMNSTQYAYFFTYKNGVVTGFEGMETNYRVDSADQLQKLFSDSRW